ncbi:putative dehydrogenase [Bacillus sp. TS-2]|nr:putative dehydrogenase [Bacillus sp. TS-2]
MMKLGIIGCGRITEKHCQTLSQISDIDVVALSDIKVERMVAINSLLPTINKERKFHHNYLDLIERKDIDVVLIATSSGFHSEIAKAAIEQKKHIIVEKPIALSLEEAKELKVLTEQYGTQLFVCHQLRFLKSMMRIKELIDHSSLGEIYYGVGSIEINREDKYYQVSPWRGTWQHDGGMLINQGIHIIDLILWFMGDASEVYGKLMKVNKNKETEDIALSMIDFKNGSKAIIEANTVTKPYNYGYAIKLFAENGTIVIEGNQLQQINRFVINNTDVPLIEMEHDQQEHVRMYQSIYDVIFNHKASSSLVNSTSAIASLELIFAIYQSALKGEKVNLPLNRFSLSELIDWEREER